ncbi:unnamed protein product [Euphydryas editha]|uniref:DRBM domain-containing protein n=1 Tax=Euphydryas editha TaxID=104508 RepID=A0AAU9U8V8_EUPED|nr:unnamed protein product [Euphydryas editha]
MNEENETEFPPAKKQKLEDESDNVDKSESDNNIDFTEDTETSGEKFTIDDKCNNFVTQEELEKLKEFKVLDEVKSNDGDSNDEDSDSSDGKSEELPEEEIEKMLDENLPEDFKGARKPKEKPYVTRTKTFLEEKGVNQFEILPLDWMMVRHYSGMPIYMHRPTRVCTLSKPYFLGKGNTRRHDIPISAIPCLAYRRALEEEEKQKEIDRRVEEQIKNKTWLKNQTDSASQNKTGDNGGTNDQDKIEVKIDTTNDNEVSTSSIETISKGQCPFSNQTVVSTDISQTIESPQSETISELTNETNEATTSAESKQNETLVFDAIKEECISKESKDNSTNLECVNNETVNSKNVNNENVNNEYANNENVNNENANNENENNENANNENANNEGVNKEGETKIDDEIPLTRQPVVLPDGMVMPSPRVESVNTSWKTQHLTAEQINDYCKRLFKFKTVNFMHFNRWADRRKYTKARKALQYPKLPEGTKLITIPATSTGQENGGKAAKRDWVMNMNGCSYLSEFHEYVCRALQKQPVYEYKQLENASTPYQATVYIGGMQYGVGHGSSKRQAKYAAARASIQTLIPEMRQFLEPQQQQPSEPDFSFFDYVGIEDPRIAEFCAATCEPSPHAILLTCLLRNFGAGDWHVHTEMKKLEYQKIELTMRVGKHSATVVCKNKKTAKQRASQAILQALHPHVRSWGSLLRLYGSRSVKSCKEKKLEEQQITLLQDKARHNEPNYAVLDKLRHEMRKLRERDEAVVPIGTLLLADQLPQHSASNLNNVDL